MIKQVFVTLLAASALLAWPAQAQTAHDSPLYGVHDDTYRSDRDAENERIAAEREHAQLEAAKRDLDAAEREHARRDAERSNSANADEHRNEYSDGRHVEHANNATVVRCESIDNRRSYCPTGRVRSVRMVSRVSDASCIQNRSWGRNGRGIWVDHGCRADFRVIR